MSSVKFKCKECGQNVEIYEVLAGKQAECPSCRKSIVVPRHPIPPNPYHEPIMDMLNSARSVEWKFPILPQVLQTIVLSFVVLIISFLYVTIGIASQIGGTFLNLIRDSRKQMATDSTALSKSAYAIAIGIYALLYLPCWIITLPFWLIGYLWQNTFLRFMFLLVITLVIVIWVLRFYEISLTEGLDTIRSW